MCTRIRWTRAWTTPVGTSMGNRFFFFLERESAYCRSLHPTGPPLLCKEHTRTHTFRIKNKLQALRISHFEVRACVSACAGSVGVPVCVCVRARACALPEPIKITNGKMGRRASARECKRRRAGGRAWILMRSVGRSGIAICLCRPSSSPMRQRARPRPVGHCFLAIYSDCCARRCRP